jgi:hypothetical protein
MGSHPFNRAVERAVECSQGNDGYIYRCDLVLYIEMIVQWS